jgi:ribosome-binding protein aMBF1 (putative translation factor)
MNMAKKKNPFRSKSLKAAYDRYVGDDGEQRATFEEELANADVAQKIYDLRTNAGLSQRSLAKLVGTTASVICQLESSDYQGHSLSMLRRVAAALHKRVEIRFVPVRRKSVPA